MRIMCLTLNCQTGKSRVSKLFAKIADNRLYSLHEAAQERRSFGLYNPGLYKKSFAKRFPQQKQMKSSQSKV